MQRTLWDQLSEYFDTHVSDEEIHSGAADNVLIAWPPIIKLIEKKFPVIKGQRAVDFGCGAGGFCNKLLHLGFSVTGVDSSKAMIKIARKNSPVEIKYVAGSDEALKKLHKNSLVTSIMTLQFVRNIQWALKNIVAATEKGGLVIFAVFNPNYVVECLKEKTLFVTSGCMVINDVEIPVFIRSAKEYDEMLKKLGCKKILEEKPPFTKDFLRKYPMDEPINVSEYLILGYERMST